MTGWTTYLGYVTSHLSVIAPYIPMLGVVPIITSAASAISSGANIASKITDTASAFAISATKILTPAATAIVEAIIWYVQNFKDGVAAILRNLSVLAVIIAIMFGTALATRYYDRQHILTEITAVSTPLGDKINFLSRQLEEERKRVCPPVKGRK